MVKGAGWVEGYQRQMCPSCVCGPPDAAAPCIRMAS